MSTITVQIANKFYLEALRLAPDPKTLKATPSKLKDFCVVWDGETVEELAMGKKISGHNWPNKIAKINSFRDSFLKNEIQETQIYVVKDINYSESLIIDGVHRSIGFYKAYLENPTIFQKIDLTYLFFESNRIHEMYDYARLFLVNK